VIDSERLYTSLYEMKWVGFRFIIFTDMRLIFKDVNRLTVMRIKFL